MLPIQLPPSTAMSSALPTLFILAVVLGLMAATWFATPKGPNQTYVLACIRRRTFAECTAASSTG